MVELIGVGAFLGVLALGIVIGGFFVWIAAKLARVENGTFGRAIAASIAASVASGLVSWFFSFFGPGLMWSLLGALVGLLVVLWVFKSMFDTSWGKAFLIWIFQLLAIALAILIAGFTFATVLFV
jgi:uncharacterized membrane protein YeaQ/YmgE (transglycosylase-associated protein family)